MTAIMAISYPRNTIFSMSVATVSLARDRSDYIFLYFKITKSGVAENSFVYDVIVMPFDSLVRGVMIELMGQKNSISLASVVKSSEICDGRVHHRDQGSSPSCGSSGLPSRSSLWGR